MEAIDYFVKESDVNENGIMEVEIAAELVRRNREANLGYAQLVTTTAEEEINNAISNADSLPAATVSNQAPAAKPHFISANKVNYATNWWLALIAFLLFMILCNMGE